MALPNAVQVADRWHLMENASSAFLDAVRKSMRSMRTALGATEIDADLLTHAETLQYQGCGRNTEPDRFVRQRDYKGQIGRPRRNHRTMVEWANRRANHKTQNGQTPDVWQREPGSTAGKTCRYIMTPKTITEIASEPILDADWRSTLDAD